MANVTMRDIAGKAGSQYRLRVESTHGKRRSQ